MHWYPKYTSDFIGATLDLSYLEKVSYGWMLDVYYERRAPLPLDSTRLFRLLGCESDEQKQAVKTVLNMFFVKKEDGWYNEKAEDVIKKQAQKSDLAKFSAKVRWGRPEEENLNEINKTDDANAIRTQCERNADAMLSRTRSRSRSKDRSRTKQDQLPGQDQEHVLTDVITSLGVSGSNNSAAFLNTAFVIKSNSGKNLSQGGRKAPPSATKTGPTWESYSSAYQDRYGAMPVRNATVNAQILHFVNRIGVDEAPHVAAYFLLNNSRYYVERAHQVKCLLVDAEKLRTEWAMKRQVTSTLAAQADSTQSNFAVLEEVKAELRREKNHGK